jgi:hypothetical protein
MPIERIGLACPIPGERAAFMEWLSAAGYEPVPMLDLDLLARELTTRPVEALIADVALVPAADLTRLLRILGPNRPLVVVGEAAQALEQVPRDVTWIDRPVTRDNFLMSLALGLAEGRPARRSPRKTVPRLLAQIDGVASKVMDVSSEGVRFELTDATPSALPPFFTLKVASFGVAARVKRVWVASPSPSTVWCGGIVERGQPAKTKTAWLQFIETAPTTGDITIRPADESGHNQRQRW